MRFTRYNNIGLAALLGLGYLPASILAGDVLSTSGFTTCLNNGSITVSKTDLSYSKSSEKVTFDVSGTSTKQQKVTAKLTVSAYGNTYYEKSFNPCDEDTKVSELCPVPAGSFSATGSQTVPSKYADMIPSIVFSIPDVDAQGKIQLFSADTGDDVACVESDITNGKTMNLPAVTYVAMGIAAGALALSGLSALGGAGTVGGHTPSPSFSAVVGWFQSMATNGMLSVNYPTVYRSFSKNFAFSTGLVSWDQMQSSIDSFRQNTGGNLTEDSVEYLRNVTLVYSSTSKRSVPALYDAILWARDSVSTSVNSSSSSSSSSSSNSSSSNSEISHVVSGIKAYAEELTIPHANVFMTVLLIFAIILAAISVSILLFKVILEAWALSGSFPNRLTHFRKNYWMILAKTITQLILLLYGVWVIYCVYQFTNGDSWAAKTLAGVTLGAFTGVLAFFTFRIWQVAQRYKKSEGDASVLFEDKKTWLKYNIFYENYKKSHWWLFVPAIVYMFAKGCVIAAGEGHGMVQTAGQLIIESLMLILLLWNRPYATGASNGINITISVIRVLSVVCILVFVEELGIAQTTKTVTGVVLIAVQSGLTGVLAILIGVNAIITCVRENPHRKRRKEAEKLNRDLDDLTPLDARNSLLMEPTDYKDPKAPLITSAPYSFSRPTLGAAQPYSDNPYAHKSQRKSFLGKGHVPRESSENLVNSAAPIGHEQDVRSTGRPSGNSLERREPKVPNIGGAY
ncbi:MAG: hypothetical protein M1834_003793 [Cirrosporium novae-zelandiae]|nr:MAG: hypothetical protein M1834_003793 [Cirrosporium novae-zelandiae]